MSPVRHEWDNAWQPLLSRNTIEGVEAAVVSVIAMLNEMPVDTASIERVKANKGDLREVVFAPVFVLFDANEALRNRAKASIPQLSSEYGHLLAAHPAVLATRCSEYQERFRKFFGIFGSAYPSWQEQQLSRLAL